VRGARWLQADAVPVRGGHLLTGPSRRPRPVNRSLPLSTRGHLQRARSGPRAPAVVPARVLSDALRDHAANAARAQSAKREVHRVAVEDHAVIELSEGERIEVRLL